MAGENKRVTARQVCQDSSIIDDHTERKRAEKALRFLSEASIQLGASLDYEATLRRVARLALPLLADFCIVDLLADDGHVRRVAATHINPGKEELLRKLQGSYPADAGSPAPASGVLCSGQSELIPDVSEEEIARHTRDAKHAALIRDIGLRSHMAVSLRARGRVLGALSFGSTESERRYGPGDLALAEALAHRCAQAIDNARLYREAQEAVRARDEFISVAAHELRTPVTTIKGYAQLLLRRQASGQLTPERLASSCRVIDQATSRLARLTEDLLDLWRMRAGHLGLDLAPVDLAELTREAVSRHRELLTRQLQVRVEVPGKPCPVMADAERIEQVLSNLLDNAAKYSPEGGEIRVTLRAQGESFVIQVEDPGIGLPAGTAETIFEPFERASNAAERHLPGMGLGLSICRSIAERHQGHIWAESAGEDRGTCMFLELPAGWSAGGQVAD